MQLNEYAELARETAVYPDAGERTNAAISYAVLGLCGEVGELANTWKKLLRKPDASFDELRVARAAMLNEMGDILWYLSACAHELNIGSLDYIANENLLRLRKRKANNTLTNLTHED